MIDLSVGSSLSSIKKGIPICFFSKTSKNKNFIRVLFPIPALSMMRILLYFSSLSLLYSSNLIISSFAEKNIGFNVNGK